jgi:CRP-like cAMP-binding protein
MLQEKSSSDAMGFLARVIHGRAPRSYERNENVYVQGDPAGAVFYIQSGTVLARVVSCQGKEAIISMLSAGDFFGEGCLSGQPRRTSSAAALSKCAIMRIEKAAMLRLLQEEPTFEELFIQYLLSRNTRSEEDLVDNFFSYSEKRLARTLIRLANLTKTSTADHPFPKITQSMLADIVGTTRARISFFMNRFRELRLIDYNPGFHVYSALEQFVEAPQESPCSLPRFDAEDELDKTSDFRNCTELN